MPVVSVVNNFQHLSEQSVRDWGYECIMGGTIAIYDWEGDIKGNFTLALLAYSATMPNEEYVSRNNHTHKSSVDN